MFGRGTGNNKSGLAGLGDVSFDSAGPATGVEVHVLDGEEEDVEELGDIDSLGDGESSVCSISELGDTRSVFTTQSLEVVGGAEHETAETGANKGPAPPLQVVSSPSAPSSTPNVPAGGALGSFTVPTGNACRLNFSMVGRQQPLVMGMWGTPVATTATASPQGGAVDRPPEQEVPRYEGHGNATVFSCVINLTNTLIGVGTLGLPFAFAQAGAVTGTILLGAAAGFSINGLRLLSISATTAGGAGPSSFYSVASVAWRGSPFVTVLIDASVAIKCFGVATGFLITVGDCMVDACRFILQQAFPDALSPSYERILLQRHLWVSCAVVVVLPISFFKTLDSLKSTSFVSLVLLYGLAVGIVLYAHGVLDPCLHNAATDATTVASAISGNNSPTSSLEERQLMWNYFEDEQQCKGDFDWFTNVQSTIRNVAVFIFSFTCHQNIFSLANEIRRHTQRRVDTVIFTSIGCALFLYLVVALEGYRTFGTLVTADVLRSYPETWVVTVMRISIAVMVLFSYPLQLDPSRRCIASLIRSFGCVNRTDDDRQEGYQPLPSSDGEAFLRTESNRQNEDDENGASTNLRPQQDCNDHDEDHLFCTITCAFLFLSFAIAMVVSDLGIVLDVVGATGSTVVTYILPGAIYIKLHPTTFSVLKGLAYLQLVIGCLIIPTALYFVIH